MLAYRHAFHAGNHADVLKHVVLALVLRYMNRRTSPTAIDTHAGAGGYSLEGRYAQKKGEFEHGIGEAVAARRPAAAVADYVQLVRRFNPRRHAGAVPRLAGVRAHAAARRRPAAPVRAAPDRPPHPAPPTWARGKGAEVRSRWLRALKGQLPPPSRRGVVLIDPSYEGQGDYAAGRRACARRWKRFADGVYMVWYPQVQQARARRSCRKRLKALAPKGWLHARLTVQPPDAQGFGLPGSGVFVINPPHAFCRAAPRLPLLVEELGQFDGASFLLEQRTA